MLRVGMYTKEGGQKKNVGKGVMNKVGVFQEKNKEKNKRVKS